MSRPRGGYIGHYATPAEAAANSAATGVWTLREAESLKRAGTWPTVGEQGVAPATPTGLAQTACDVSIGEGTIEWDSVAGATSYVLEWQFGGTEGSWTEAFNGANTSVALDVQSFGEEAWYRVKAVNSTGSSEWSEPVFAACSILG